VWERGFGGEGVRRRSKSFSIPQRFSKMKADSKVISQLNESSSTIHKTVEREMNYIEVCGHYHFLSTKDVLNDEILQDYEDLGYLRISNGCMGPTLRCLPVA
jgi:hypothetical protein